VRRPESFHGFFGQRKAVRFLARQLQGAQALGDPCPHLLIIGPSGMGKTRLAQALAAEAGTTCRVVHGKAAPRDLCEALVGLKGSDFLFLDEAHRLGRDSQTLLFDVIDAGRAPDLLDAQAQARRDPADGRLVIEPLTVVLATDQPGRLLEALVRRMEHTVHLSDYSRAELTEIVAATASELELLVTPQALGALAAASQGQPRRALHLLRGMRREHSGDRQRHQLTAEHVRKYLQAASIDGLGLTPEQQLYLLKLRKLGSASLATLASLIGADEEYVAARLEPGLIKLDYVRKGRVGRKLTPAGKGWVRKRREEAKAKKATEQKEGRRENA
jgi:Holliday junction resolvasome RuvABC ATP-dependent DNA helicase subunit